MRALNERSRVSNLSATHPSSRGRNDMEPSANLPLSSYDLRLNSINSFTVQGGVACPVVVVAGVVDVVVVSGAVS